MIVMSGVDGTPRDPNDNLPDDFPDFDAEPEPDPDADPDADPATRAGRLWRTFTDWIDRYAWAIITLGVALILLDVLLVLVVLLYQVNR